MKFLYLLQNLYGRQQMVPVVELRGLINGSSVRFGLQPAKWPQVKRDESTSIDMPYVQFLTSLVVNNITTVVEDDFRVYRIG